MAKTKKLVLSDEAREFFAAIGREHGHKGGTKSAANLTEEQRRERALKAVAARKWHKVLTPKERKARDKAKKANKKPVGRPRLTDEEKAARAAARAAAGKPPARKRKPKAAA